MFQLLRQQQKLQFYMRIYFLIYPIHPNLNQNHKNVTIPQKQINSFRQFLDTKGADLAKTSQFLQFYALPFIKKPLEHAKFKTLFTKAWVGNLKQKLISFIEIQQQGMKQSIKSFCSSLNINSAQKSSNSYSKPLGNQAVSQSSSKQAALYQQKYKKLEHKNKELFEQVQAIQERYKSLQENHQAMIQSFNDYMMDSQNKWFDSYKQLVKISKGLLEIVANTPIQNPKFQRRYLQARKRIDKFDKFVAKRLQDLLSVSQDISVFDRPSMNQISQYTMKSGYTSKSWLPNNVSNNLDKNSVTVSNNNNNITSYVQIDEYVSTNFKKLNNQFWKLPQHQQVIIIEGFTWRLIKAKSMQIRRFFCISMISNNFIGLGKIDTQSSSNSTSPQQQLQLCTKYLTNKLISLQILELLNYIKLDYYSRQHLFLHHNITQTLMQIMAESLQQFNLQPLSIALDILSTVSAYRDYQFQILKKQLPIFLLNALEQYPKLFQYEEIMELVLIILMNFCSFTEGLAMFEEYVNVFQTLSPAFEQEFPQIMLLVSGFYYTLLSNQKLFEIAHQSNMPEFINYLLNEPKYKQHKRQLKFIQSRLVKFNYQPPQQQISKNSNPNIDQKQEVCPIDGQQQYQDLQMAMQDDLQNLQQYLKGHELLTNRYSLKQKQNTQQQNLIRKIDSQFVIQMENKKLQNIQNQQVQNRRMPAQQKTKEELPSEQNQKQLKAFNIRNIPQQSKLKKVVEMKTQQIHVSLINLEGKASNPQSSIKEEIFRSPTPKTDLIKRAQQPIPKNSKQAQFMGVLNQQQNPTFAKQKQYPIQFLSSPMTENQNPPHFGSPPQGLELKSQQRNRRKQILKQINEQIQIKNSLKAEKRQTKDKQKSKSTSDKNILASQNANFLKNKQSNENEQDWNKGGRSNIHIKKEVLDQKTKSQRQKQRKAFQSKPKIVRTPPKQDQQ